MSWTQHDFLSQRVNAVIQQFHSSGLEGVVSEEEAWNLFDEAWSFHYRHPSSPDLQGLLVRASLISHVTFAVKAEPEWRNIATRGAYGSGSLWFVPEQPDIKRLYALLLTNCVIACCVYGNRLQELIRPLASGAYSLFQQLSNPEADRWVGALYVAMAHAENQGGARVQYAQKALHLLEPLSPEPQELGIYAAYLAGQGDGTIAEPGLLGTRWRTRSHRAFFGLRDLYLFSDR